MKSDGLAIMLGAVLGAVVGGLLVAHLEELAHPHHPPREAEALSPCSWRELGALRDFMSACMCGGAVPAEYATEPPIETPEAEACAREAQRLVCGIAP